MKANGKKPEVQVKAQLTITLYTNGEFQVNGPLDDHILYYGLLGMAHNAPAMQAGRQAQQQMKAESVKGSAPWWKKIFAGKVKGTEVAKKPTFDSAGAESKSAEAVH
jgi:hypothetical protein